MWVGGRCCWAQLWMVKAAAVAREAGDGESDEKAGSDGTGEVLPPRGRVMAMRSAATPIWRVASWPVGTRCEVWARARR